MAHTCPVCGQHCTCNCDWDDIDFGEVIDCIHCSVIDEDDEPEKVPWLFYCSCCSEEIEIYVDPDDMDLDEPHYCDSCKQELNEGKG